MDESQQNTLRERSHPHTQKNYTLYDSIYMKFWQKQKCSKRKQMVGARSRGSGRGLTPEGQWRSLGGGDEIVLYLDWDAGYTTVDICQALLNCTFKITPQYSKH